MHMTPSNMHRHSRNFGGLPASMSQLLRHHAYTKCILHELCLTYVVQDDRQNWGSTSLKLIQTQLMC